MIDNAAAEFDVYAEDLLERMNSGNPRESQYLPVNASASAWVVGCETTLAGRFCVNARIFDSYDTSPAIFYDALMGIQESSELVTEIRDQDLAWPVDRTFITRGYKTCGCGDNHYGLDLAAAIGTLFAPLPTASSATLVHFQVGAVPSSSSTNFRAAINTSVCMLTFRSLKKA